FERLGKVRRVPRWRRGRRRSIRVFLLRGGVFTQRRFLGFVPSPAQHGGNRRAELAMFERLPHRLGHILGLILVVLRGSEHHHEEGEQQRHEIGIGHQPAFVVGMCLGFPAGHRYLLMAGRDALRAGAWPSWPPHGGCRRPVSGGSAWGSAPPRCRRRLPKPCPSVKPPRACGRAVCWRPAEREYWPSPRHTLWLR